MPGEFVVPESRSASGTYYAYGVAVAGASWIETGTSIGGARQIGFDANLRRHVPRQDPPGPWRRKSPAECSDRQPVRRRLALEAGVGRVDRQNAERRAAADHEVAGDRLPGLGHAHPNRRRA